MNKVVCGIDFGTSNTAVAVTKGPSDICLVPVDDKSVTIPSTIFFADDKRHIHFGRAATQAYIAGDEGRYMRSFKRVLGTKLMKEGTTVAGQKIKFQDILGRYIKVIKNKAEAFAETDITDVVAGRPVHFVDDDEKANLEAEEQLRQVYTSIGFRNIRFQFEPIAAAFAHEAKLGDKEHLAIVIDIGGGTSDFTIIRLSGRYTSKLDRQNDILANEGLRLGGNDFDRALSWSSFMPLLGLGSQWGKKNLPFPTAPFADLAEWSKIQWMYAPQYKRKFIELVDEAHDKKRINRLLHIIESELGHRFMGCIEDTKIALSDEAETTTDLAFIESGLTATSTRAQFEEAMSKNIRKIEAAIESCLKQAGITGEAVELAILTGGGTGIPQIIQTVRRLFPQAAMSEGDRLSSVGLGLAFDAKRHFLN